METESQRCRSARTNGTRRQPVGVEVRVADQVGKSNGPTALDTCAVGPTPPMTGRSAPTNTTAAGEPSARQIAVSRSPRTCGGGGRAEAARGGARPPAPGGPQAGKKTQRGLLGEHPA